MSIVLTEIESIHGSTNRMIFYRCQDDSGVWHNYGPVMTSDPAFDADAHKTIVAERVAFKLADAEFARTVEEI